MIARLNQSLDRLARAQAPWWLWPLALVLLMVVSDTASLVLQPAGDSWVAFPNGSRFGDTCAMIQTTGHPCPQCGMTRAWVHGIRGDLVASFFYNPAGLALLVWVNVGGVFGAIRLLTRNPRAARVPELVFFGWLMIWLLPLWVGGYTIRLAGWLPLPDGPFVGVEQQQADGGDADTEARDPTER